MAGQDGAPEIKAAMNSVSGDMASRPVLAGAVSTRQISSLAARATFRVLKSLRGLEIGFEPRPDSKIHAFSIVLHNCSERSRWPLKTVSLAQ